MRHSLPLTDDERATVRRLRARSVKRMIEVIQRLDEGLLAMQELYQALANVATALGCAEVLEREDE